MWANGDRARLDPGTQMETDWGILYAFSLNNDDALEEYLEAVARHHTVEGFKETPVGWCS